MLRNALLAALYAFLVFAEERGQRIDVRAFGARADGGDDTKALQSAIDASREGATITLPAGEYHLSRPLALRSNRAYQGSQGTVIHAKSGEFAAVTAYDATSNISIEHLTFANGGIHIAGEHTPARKVRISQSTFVNIQNTGPNWPVHTGIFCSSGLQDSTIVGNQFTNILDGGSTDAMKNLTASGILIYNGLDRSSIADNHFDTVHQAISIQFDRQGPYRDAVIARNVGVRVHRMGIELQGGNTTDLIVEDNSFSDFLDPNVGTFALSIVVDGGRRSVIRNNAVIARPAATTHTPWGTGYGIGIEIGGADASVYGNYIGGLWATGIAVGKAPNVTIHGNYLCGSPGAMQIKHETSLQLNAVIRDNTNQATCKPAPQAGQKTAASVR